jgi:uncharacterized protein (TIRG00374 family)
LAISGVAIWIVAPSVIASIGRFPQLRRVSVGWFLIVGLLESLALVCMWELTRIALRTRRWFDVACAQLAGNALSRAIPGGAATGGTLEYQMLTSVDFDRAATTTALTATGLLSTGMLFALPVLAVPSLLSGLAVTDRLAHGIILAAVLGVFLFAGGATLLLSDRVVRTIGGILDRTGYALQIARHSKRSMASRLVESRDIVRDALAVSWTRAVAAAFGNQAFDFLALYASVLAVGAHLHPGVALFAFVVASTLAMIPFTPGGLGFVESGLTGVLTVAGLTLDQAVLATLLYRLFSYWAPIPAGLVAAAMFKHRHTRLT